MDEKAKGLKRTPVDSDAKPTLDEVAAEVIKVIPPVHVCGKTWYDYKDGVWSVIEGGPGCIGRVILEHKLLTKVKRHEKYIASLLRQIATKKAIRDESAFAGAVRMRNGVTYVNAANGVVAISLETGKHTLMQHHPDYYFTSRVAANYNPAAKSELFEMVLHQSLPDPMDRRLFGLWFARTLIPNSQLECSLVCYGDTGTGKSTLVESGIGSVFGKAATTTLTLSEICKEESKYIHLLRNSSLNIGTELNTLDLADSSNFKRIVSGERFMSRKLYSNARDTETSAKLVFLANHLPRFKHGTAAESRRLRFIHFTRKPNAETVSGKVKERVAAERDGIFNFLLAHVAESAQLRTMPYGSEASARVQATFDMANDLACTFVNLWCELGEGPEYRVTTDELISACNDFLYEEGITSMDGARLYRQLRERYQFKRSRARDGSTPDQTFRGTQRRRYNCGVRLKAEHARGVPENVVEFEAAHDGV